MPVMQVTNLLNYCSLSHRLKRAGEGKINAIKIYGDFFGKEPVTEIEDLLVNTRYSPEDIEEVLLPIDVQSYFGNIQKEEFLQLVYGEDEE